MQISFASLFTKLFGYKHSWTFDIPVGEPYSDSIVDDFTVVIDALNRENIEYFLGDGALLGLVRDGMLIKHDTDIDFYILAAEHEEIIVNLMLGLGYRIGRHVKKFKTTYQVVFYNNNKSIIDFCFWRKNPKNGNYIWWAPEIKYPLNLQARYVNEHSLISWRGVNIRTFSTPERWLEHVYGTDWQIPEESKGDWRDRGDYSNSRYS